MWKSCYTEAYPSLSKEIFEKCTGAMNIQYYGDFCFKISTKPAGRATEDIVIWTDPLQKGAGLRSPQGQVDLIFLSHSKREEMKDVLKEETVVFDAPGEYAAKGVAALGFLTYRDTEEGKARGQNTVFIFESEGIHLCYLGALGHDITPELLDKLSGVDIVFIPVGGGDTTSAKLAAELVRKIEPSIVIPMHYKIPGLTLSLETEKAFCDALGNCPAQALPKLNIKQKDLEGKKMEVVILERGV
ncbi:MAG: hypothetical protein A2878_03065 [Candidatus Moranbacteria bacterium RIFCSPHIGHO2_01_FULL_54_31]|nr:MAG: hypothetical protein A2878_03065 [Candidatus Moranbacteria bacterium RIFCSPHIGHO2_01_FULL_54_31]